MQYKPYSWLQTPLFYSKLHKPQNATTAETIKFWRLCQQDQVTNDIMVGLSGVSLYLLIGLLVTVSLLCYIAQNWIGSILQYSYLFKFWCKGDLDRSIAYL